MGRTRPYVNYSAVYWPSRRETTILYYLSIPRVYKLCKTMRHGDFRTYLSFASMRSDLENKRSSPGWPRRRFGEASIFDQPRVAFLAGLLLERNERINYAAGRLTLAWRLFVNAEWPMRRIGWEIESGAEPLKLIIILWPNVTSVQCIVYATFLYFISIANYELRISIDNFNIRKWKKDKEEIWQGIVLLIYSVDK